MAAYGGTKGHKTSHPHVYQQTMFQLRHVGILRVMMLWLLIAICLPLRLHAATNDPINGFSASTNTGTTSGTTTDYAVPRANGFRFGQWRLHPYLNMDTHWVTNPGRLPGSQGTSDVMSVLRPGLKLELATPKLHFKTIGGVNLQKYWGVLSDTTKRFTTVSGDGSLTLDVFPIQPYGGSVFVQVNRTANIGNQIVVERIQHTMVESGVSVRVQPGGGALRAMGSYNFFYDRYDRNILNAGQLDNYRHRPKLRLDWKFLPKTSLLAEVGGELTRYFSNASFVSNINEAQNGVNPQATQLFNVNANTISAVVGLDGVITRKITATAKIGYVKAILDSASDKQTVAATLEGQYRITPRQQLQLGVMHGVQPTSLFRYFVNTNAYATYNYVLPWKMELQAGASYVMRDYGSPVNIIVHRIDHQVSGVVSITQPITSWLDVALIETVDWVTSNYMTAQGPATYLFNDINLRIQVHY